MELGYTVLVKPISLSVILLLKYQLYTNGRINTYSNKCSKKCAHFAKKNTLAPQCSVFRRKVSLIHFSSYSSLKLPVSPSTQLQQAHFN